MVTVRIMSVIPSEARDLGVAGGGDTVAEARI